MIKHVAFATGCGVLLAFALGSAGCGRSSHVVAPTSDAVKAAGVAALDRGEVSATSARDGEEQGSDHAQPINGPTTITRSGDYRLTTDLRVESGDAIVITASHVRLWLGKHRLYGPGNKLGRAVVIDGAEDVVVRGGHVEHFGFGAVLVNASYCRLRDLTIEGGDEIADPANGNPPQIGIMLVNSSKNYLGGNRVQGVNLGIFVRGGGSYRNLIQRNSVTGGAHGLLAICYNPAPGAELAGPMKDRVQFNVLERFGTGIAASALSAENVFAMNRIHYFNAAYDDKNGSNVFVRNDTRQITP